MLKNNNQAFLSTMLDSVVDAIIVINENGVIQTVNSAVFAIFGYSPAEIIGKNVSMLMPDGKRVKHEQYLKNYINGGEARVIGTGLQDVGLRKDRSLFQLDLSISEMHVDNERMFIGVIRDISHIVNTEKALHSSEYRFSTAQQFAKFGVWDWNIETNDLYWSEGISQLIGYGEGEIETTYQNFLNAIHLDDREIVESAIQEALEGKQDYLVDHRVVWPNGITRWVREAGDIVRDENGSPVKMIGVAIDITASKEFELALIESERQLKEAQRIGHIGNWSWDVESGRLFWSDEIFRIFGHQPGEFEPTYERFLSVLPPEDVERIKKSEEAAFSKGETHSIDHRIMLPSGEMRWVHEEAEAVLGEDGGPERLQGTVQDITDRKNAEEQLYARETMFENVFNASEDAILILDDGYFIECNDAAVRMLHASGREEVLSTSPWDLSPERQSDGESSKEKSLEMIRLAYEKNFHRFEWVYRRVDGVEFPVEVTLTPTRMKNRQVLHVVWNDITERKKQQDDLRVAKDEAESANLAKSKFLSSMSHELRTPMNAILGFSQLLELEEGLEEDHRQSVTDIRTAGEHLLELINDVLDFARIESGKIRLKFEPVNIEKVLCDCQTLTQPMAQAAGITLEFQLEECRNLMLFVDRTRLKQVVINLVSNAIKYNKPGGRAKVLCQPGPDQRVCISVTDSGIGIKQEALNDLFEPFHRLGAEGGKIEGTGIGLVISRQLAEMMNGEIVVESEYGVGSTFSLLFDCSS